MLSVMISVVVLIFCVISALKTTELCKRKVSLEKFVPPVFGCNVNWVLDTNGISCIWCEAIFINLIKRLNWAYNPSSINTESRDFNETAVANFDLKGVCFINWFVGTGFNHVASDIQFHRFSAFRNSNWFLFIQERNEELFLSSWKQAIYGLLKYTGVYIEYPRAVLIVLGNDILQASVQSSEALLREVPVTFAVSWYTFALDSDSFFNWNEFGEKNDPWKILLNKTAGKHEFGVPFSCCYNHWGDWLFEFEGSYFASWRPQPQYLSELAWSNHVMSAAARHLNFNQTNPNTQKPSLLAWYREKITTGPRNFMKMKVLNFFTISDHIVYCRTMGSQDTNSVLLDLLSPFDTFTWVIICVLALVTCGIPFIRCWRLIDCVASMLGQPPQAKKLGVLLILLCILLIPIQTSYRDYFTTNAVKPYEKEYINTNQELFDSGFRIICYYSNSSLCFLDIFNMNSSIIRVLDNFNINSSINGVKLNWTAMEQYILYVKDLDDNETPLSQTRDRGARIVWKQYTLREILWSETTPQTQCHAVPQPWSEEAVAIFYGGIFADALYETFAKLMQAGIAEYWKSAVDSIEKRKSEHKAESLIYSNLDTEIAYMNSSIQSLCIIFAMLHACNIILFALEMLFVIIAGRIYIFIYSILRKFGFHTLSVFE